MKRKLTILLLLIVCFSSAQAQTLETNEDKRTVLEFFTDTLKELSASYYAHYRVWEDLDIPAPKVKMNADYHKLFMPPTYYNAPIEQAFELDWKPGKKLAMSAVDSLYTVWTDTVPRYDLPKVGNSVETDRWVNKILLDAYLQHPNMITGNEAYFADVKVLQESQKVVTPRKEDIKSYVQVGDNRADADTELLIVKPNFWKKTAYASLHFSQYSISDNWYQGGESTNALNSELRLTANYDDKQKVQFENTMEIKLGFITAPSDTVHHYKTNADLFRLNSKLGVKAAKNLYYTLIAQFKTQFFSNYRTNTNDLISTFLSPAQLDLSLGLDYKLDRPKYSLSVAALPLSYTFVYIANDDIINPSSFNVEPGRSTANMYGSRITANLNWTIIPNLTYRSKFEYFTTYEKVIANWENTFEFKFNRYLSTKIFFHTRFDDGVTLTEDNDSYFQFKENLTFGLTYTW